MMLPQPPRFRSRWERFLFSFQVLLFGYDEAVFRQHLRSWDVSPDNNFGITSLAECLGLFVRGGNGWEERFRLVEEVDAHYVTNEFTDADHRRLYIAVFRHIEAHPDDVWQAIRGPVAASAGEGLPVRRVTLYA